MELDDKGFWGCRQEFKKGMQIQSPGLEKVEGGKYNSPEPNGSGIGSVKYCVPVMDDPPGWGKPIIFWGDKPGKRGLARLWGLGPGFALKKLDTNRAEAMNPQIPQAIVPLPRQNRGPGGHFPGSGLLGYLRSCLVHGRPEFPPFRFRGGDPQDRRQSGYGLESDFGQERSHQHHFLPGLRENGPAEA